MIKEIIMAGETLKSKKAFTLLAGFKYIYNQSMGSFQKPVQILKWFFLQFQNTANFIIKTWVPLVFSSASWCFEISRRSHLSIWSVTQNSKYMHL